MDGSTEIKHKGTGRFSLIATDSCTIGFAVSDTWKQEITSTIARYHIPVELRYSGDGEGGELRWTDAAGTMRWFQDVDVNGHMRIFGNTAGQNLTIYANNLPVVTFKANQQVQYHNVPVFADNAAAISGGLPAGTVYRTSTGVLMAVY